MNRAAVAQELLRVARDLAASREGEVLQQVRGDLTRIADRLEALLKSENPKIKTFARECMDAVDDIRHSIYDFRED